METIHIKGIANEIDLHERLAEGWPHIDLDFNYEEESEDSLPRVFFRFYESNKECSLEDALRGHLTKFFGDVKARGQEYGYSEYTIEGFSIHELTLGGHDLAAIIKSRGNKYLHILIDVIPKS